MFWRESLSREAARTKTHPAASLGTQRRLTVNADFRHYPARPERVFRKAGSDDSVPLGSGRRRQDESEMSAGMVAHDRLAAGRLLSGGAGFVFLQTSGLRKNPSASAQQSGSLSVPDALNGPDTEMAGGRIARRELRAGVFIHPFTE